MKLDIHRKSLIQKIERMQSVLAEAESESTKAKAQEEVLLKQLSELFECESIEEGKELLDALMQEKDELDNDIETQTNNLYEKMQADGLL